MITDFSRENSHPFPRCVSPKLICVTLPACFGASAGHCYWFCELSWHLRLDKA